MRNLTLTYLKKKHDKREDLSVFVQLNIPVNVYPHHFRHTYACQLLDNGAPLDFIQGMLGHKKASPNTDLCPVTGGASKRTI